MRAKIFAAENRKWWTLGALSLRPVHDHARQHGRERRAAGDQARPRDRHLGARVVGCGLRPDVRVLLLTGGKLGDLLGRRLIFIDRPRRLHRSPRSPAASPRARTQLIAARAVQGVGAALMMPATLSIITATFARASAGWRSGSGPASPRWRSRSGRCSAASSPSTSPGTGSSTSTSRSAILAVDRRDRGRAGIEGHLARAAARPARPAHLGDRPARARLRTDRGATATAGRRRGSSASSSVAAVALGSLRAARDAPAAADARPLALPQRRPSPARTSSRSSSRWRCSGSSSSSRSTCRPSSAGRRSRRAPRCCRGRC